MNFEEMIECFGDYTAELRNFKTYLLSDSTSINTKLLGGIRTEHIIDSIDYNIKHNNYKSKSIAYKYISAIAQFYRHAEQNHWFTNEDLLKKINAYRLDESSYYSQVNNYIKKNVALKKKRSHETYTEIEANELISGIDYYFELNSKTLDKISYPKICSMLAIKVMLLTGAKYNVIRKLKYKDLDTLSNTLLVNEFQIRLPINLSIQFQVFNQVRNKANLTSEYLFTTQTGSQWGERTKGSSIVDLLSVFIMRQDTTGLTKFGIRNLLKAGTGIKEIEQLTGAKEGIIRSCVSVDFEIDKTNQMNNYINMKLATTDSYYKL